MALKNKLGTGIFGTLKFPKKNFKNRLGTDYEKDFGKGIFSIVFLSKLFYKHIV